MLDDRNLKNYINTFYGYGKWNAPFWFIGIEENGGYSIEDTMARIESWSMYKLDLLDIREHHKNIGLEKFFTEGKYQPTWWGLMKLKNFMVGKESSTAILRNIQKNSWGQKDSENLILDLFPLPSPSVQDWKYSKWSEIPYLSSRSQYFNEIADKRIDYLQKKINLFEPRVVFLYGSSMINYWDKIVGKSFSKDGEKHKVGRYYIRLLENESTLFVQIPHPAAIRGSKWFDDAGVILNKYLLDRRIKGAVNV